MCLNETYHKFDINTTLLDKVETEVTWNIHIVEFI